MSDLVADVRAFHEKFGVPVGELPRLLSDRDFSYRLEFLREELGELLEAHQRYDAAGFIDALVDLTYVAIGTALWGGYDFDAHWAEVQRANLAKVKVERAVLSRRSHEQDVVKPLGWQPPRHEPLFLVTRHARVEG